ncbi:FixH family protein [Roseomonas frigidaquae]|uniref:FixH family protein n=1 Tax=Falsiroseomonas frigidaquae TaxID=487318 RepID=A0ABX1F319_9PROT|nr:FixH family protein [Falsiroseomonas frigidaquae]NKE46743.1 FixH family protein [Falsiroseomonas frigidaquae]
MSHAMPSDPRRSRWIPWVFVGGMLLVVVVNGGLIFAALSTFTGVTVGKSFDRGRSYNHVLQEAARQQALGWEAQVKLEGGLVSVVVVDRQGQPVAGVLQGHLQRPLEGSQVPLSFRQTGPGRFEAPAALPLPGQWEARLLLRDAAGDAFDIRRRLIAS